MRLVQAGPRKTRIVIVGEAPGNTEMSTGVPFSGGSGELLNRMLSRVGLSRDECFLTNVCHIQPQGKKLNDFDWFFTRDGQSYLLAGMIQLQADLKAIKPNLVVALGTMPLRVLTGKVGIDKWRGSILPATLVPGLKVLGTYHPAYCLRIYDYKTIVEWDLLRAVGDSQFPDLRYPERTIYLPGGLVVRRSPEGNWTQTTEPYSVDALVEEFLNASWLGQDIESVQRPDRTSRVSCCSFSDRPDRALVISNDSATDRLRISTLSGSSVPKVFQNGAFDYTVLTEMNDIPVRGFGEHHYTGNILTSVEGWDTMLAQHALYPECASGADEYSALKKSKKLAAIRKGLGFLVSINTREPYYKDDGKIGVNTGDIALYWRYNGLDSCCAREIKDVQERELTAFGTTKTFMHKMALLRPLFMCMKRGIALDVPARKKLASELESELSILQIFLDSGAGRHINVQSNGVNGDVGKLLYGQLGIPIRYNKKTKNPTVDKDAIIQIAAEHQHPLILTILAIRERRKILETYLASPIDSDNRMRCSYDPTGTNTNRLSSRETIWDTGGNLQNQPDKIRRTFIPDSGHVFIQPDFSQAEARVVAYLAREQRMIDLFNDPSKDFHIENATFFYDLDAASITYEMRYCAKRCGHASNYGMRGTKAAAVINQDAKDTWGKPGTHITIDIRTADRNIERYHMLYPGIKASYWYDVVQQLKRNRTLTGVFGFKRTFHGRWESDDDSNFLFTAYALIPQNAIGELCTQAMVAVEDTAVKSTLLGNNHDSLLSICRDDPDEVEAAIAEIAQCMHIPITVHGKTFYIPSEFQVGYNWGKASKDGSNPHGLIEASKWLELRHKAKQPLNLSTGG